MDNFIHLHGHSEYSALDGGSTIKEILRRVKDIGQNAIALTEHGNVDSAFKFYNYSKKENIKPIIGIESYFAQDGIENKGENFHLVLLCKNYQGWKNLLKMVRISSVDGFYYHPRIDIALLSKYHEGLIALSGCLGGIISKPLIKGEYAIAAANIQAFKNMFGDDFYLEIQNHGTPEDIKIFNKILEINKEYNIKMVATNDFHYAKKEDSITQDILLCEGIKTTFNSEKRMRLYKDGFYIKTREEMYSDVKNLSDNVDNINIDNILDNTIEISDKCILEFPSKKIFLPKIENSEFKFDSLVKKGKDKYKHLFESTTDYQKRLDYEVEVIKEANLVNYFLTVHDFISFAKQNNIMVGPGRGSVGGCLIGFLLGIHMIDPIKYNLMFSRFYNQGRVGSLPDIDIDFGSSDIETVLKYLEEKYGYNNVAHIGTLTTYAPRGAFKAVCRVMNIPYNESNQMVELIDKKSKTLKEALELSDTLKNKYEYEDAFYAGNLKFRDIYDYALKIEGHISHKGIHAAGIIISSIPLDEILPLRKEKRSNLLVTCWDMHDVEDNGLIKYDFLKVDVLDALKETLSHKNIPYNNLEDIPIDNNSTEVNKLYDLLSNTNNVGIFQLSGNMGVDITNKLKPKEMKDIAVAIALNRPGCINLGLHTKYIMRKNGDEDNYNPYKIFDDILKDTQGLMIYQEQVIQMCIALGFTPEEADTVRKIMGKKKPELLDKVKPDFFDKCINKNISEKQTEELWDHILESSSYLFNLSHSVGYGHITYYTAFFKANYPLEYMCALLNTSINDIEKLNIYLEECRNLGIEITQPIVGYSNNNFSIKDGKIIYGLLGIKGLGNEVIKILTEHDNYEDISDFCNKTKISKGYLEALIKAGALDHFGYNRATLLENIDKIVNVIAARKKHLKKKMIPLFDYGMQIKINEVEDYPVEKLAEMEYELLNTYLKYNPLEKYRKWIIKNIPNHDNLIDGEYTKVAGYVQEWEIRKTKNGKDYANIKLYSPERIWRILIFSQELPQCISKLEDYKMLWFDGKYQNNAIITKNCGAI